MSDMLDKAAGAIKKTVDNVKDTIHEGEHRSAADAERAKRDVAGSEMTVGEKAGSMLNEAKHRAAAEIDKTKRDVRSETNR